MALKSRLLKVTFTLPNGEVVIDQSISIHVRITKTVLSIQNSAVVDIIGLTTSLRTALLSNFTAYRNNQVQQGISNKYYIPIKIEAGWSDGKSSASANPPPVSVVFLGEVAFADPLSGPPNIGVRLTCYTHQIDKTRYVTNPAPSPTTFLEYVRWAGAQMGFEPGSIICNTSFNSLPLSNMSASTHHVSALIWDIQDVNKPAVVAYIDDSLLIVKDADKFIDPSTVPQAGQFIGIPNWNEWGITFTNLFDPNLLLGHGVEVFSEMNEGLNGSYVITQLDYDLASREGPFYVSVKAAVPAQ